MSSKKTKKSIKVIPKDRGIKFDEGKTRLDLIPAEFLFAVGEILTYGAEKYSERNWEAGMKWSRVFGALMRHMWKWWSGENLDPETGKSHLWHAATNMVFLVTYEMRGTGENDKADKDGRIIKGTK